MVAVLQYHILGFVRANFCSAFNGRDFGIVSVSGGSRMRDVDKVQVENCIEKNTRNWVPYSSVRFFFTDFFLLVFV